MICRKCGHEKIQVWRNDRRCLDWQCRNCQKIWHKKNKERLNKLAKERYIKNRAERLMDSKKRREDLWFSGKREECLKRDNYTCQTCNSKENLCVHHKDKKGRRHKSPNNNLDNLITLCSTCHCLLHHTKHSLWTQETKDKFKKIEHCSNREIARQLGVTHPTVAKMRVVFGND